jgi:DEAD/DEAH box helicase domain-containing protein
MRSIVFDIETKNTFREVGSQDPADLDISLLAIHDSQNDEYTVFMEDELTDLWPILESADSLIGYNSDHFDVPLLDKYYPGDLTKLKSVDIMKSIQDTLGRRLKLDDVAEATLGEKKSADGMQAITWWKNGEIDKIKKYCIQDVKVTKGVYDYALKHGHIKYPDAGDIRKVPLATDDWEQSDGAAMTHSMGF